MPNILFRKKIINQIKSTLRDFDDVARIGHPGMKGKIRELAAKNLFIPLLPAGFNIKERAKVIDHLGNESSEIDLIIFNKKLLPTVMYSDEDQMFPSEICFISIEVKSKITANGIKDTIKKARRLRNIQYISGIFDEKEKPISHPIIPILPVLFAFTTDLSEFGISELDRYKKYDEDFKIKPFIKSICVVGRGYWVFRKGWSFNPPTKDYDEVIDFLSHIINTLHFSLSKRKFPRLGQYLMLPGREK